MLKSIKKNQNACLQLNMKPNIVLLIDRSQFEEMGGMETPPRPTPTISMDSLGNPITPLAAECSKASGTGPNIQQGLTLPLDAPSSSQDIGGMMKIVPSELDVSSSPCIIIQQDVQNEIYLSMIMFLIFKCILFLHPLNFM